MSAMSVTPQAEQFGLIGLGVMGENLVLNIGDHGYRVALWTHTEGKVQRFIESNGVRRRWVATRTLEEFTAALAPPRRILLMVKAGEPVDEVLDRLAPLLSRGDVVIDGGNSFFRDTQRREAAMRERGISFVGMGVSGGEEGARYGSSLMPGGARAAYDLLRPVLEAIAAKTDSGPCVTYVGPDGAGHYVKMVHNGIEYGLMQAIAEAYDLLRRGLALPAEEVAGIFAKWNRGPLESYLIDVAAQVLGARDPATGNPLVEMILDQAGQKGTGMWTAQSALDLGTPIPTIAAAIDARILSSMKGERATASTQLRSATTGRIPGDVREMTDAIHDALRAATVCAYAQGMSLLRTASGEYGGAWTCARSPESGRAAASSAHGSSTRSCTRSSAPRSAEPAARRQRPSVAVGGGARMATDDLGGGRGGHSGAGNVGCPRVLRQLSQRVAAAEPHAGPA